MTDKKNDRPSGHPALDFLTRKEHKSGAFAMRPLTLGTYTLCCRAGILAVVCADVDDDGKPRPVTPERRPFEYSAFAYIHTAPIAEVLDAIDAGEKAFRRAVDMFSMDRPFGDLIALYNTVPKIVSDAFAALVVPTDAPDEGGEFEEKNEPGRRE